MVLRQFWWKVFDKANIANTFSSKTRQFSNKKEIRAFKPLRFYGSNNLPPKLTKNQICVYFSVNLGSGRTVESCSKPRKWFDEFPTLTDTTLPINPLAFDYLPGLCVRPWGSPMLINLFFLKWIVSNCSNLILSCKLYQFSFILNFQFEVDIFTMRNDGMNTKMVWNHHLGQI